MIAPELVIRIRSLYYAEHWKIGTIASELNLHDETVRNAEAEARTGWRRIRQERPESLVAESTVRQCVRERKLELVLLKREKHSFRRAIA